MLRRGTSNKQTPSAAAAPDAAVHAEMRYLRYKILHMFKSLRIPPVEMEYYTSLFEEAGRPRVAATQDRKIPQQTTVEQSQSQLMLYRTTFHAFWRHKEATLAAVTAIEAREDVLLCVVETTRAFTGGLLDRPAAQLSLSLLLHSLAAATAGVCDALFAWYGTVTTPFPFVWGGLCYLSKMTADITALANSTVVRTLLQMDLLKDPMLRSAPTADAFCVALHVSAAALQAAISEAKRVTSQNQSDSVACFAHGSKSAARAAAPEVPRSLRGSTVKACLWAGSPIPLSDTPCMVDPLQWPEEPPLPPYCPDASESEEGFELPARGAARRSAAHRSPSSSSHQPIGAQPVRGFSGLIAVSCGSNRGLDAIRVRPETLLVYARFPRRPAVSSAALAAGLLQSHVTVAAQVKAKLERLISAGFFLPTVRNDALGRSGGEDGLPLPLRRRRARGSGADPVSQPVSSSGSEILDSNTPGASSAAVVLGVPQLASFKKDAVGTASAFGRIEMLSKRPENLLTILDS